jgi:two-component system, sensor histidine kinase and response regulator
MKKRWFEFWADWGLVPRLMLAVGLAVVAGGLMQSALLVVEGASDHNARLERDMNEILNYLAPIVADQALTGDYAAIEQTLKKQVKRTEIQELWWTDPAGRTLKAKDTVDPRIAPAWFSAAVGIKVADDANVDVVAGGVSYGKLHGQMSPIHAQNRLWKQFVKQLQIVAATLFLMLQFIWLIFRGNLGTLRELAAGANRFSQGDYAVRIAAEGAPEVRLAADAFNNMANNTETLLTSLGQSESKNRLLASIVEQSSEAIWTTDINGIITSWNASAAALFGYSTAEAVGHTRQIGTELKAAEDERMQRLLKLEKFSYETRANTKAGALIDIQVAVAPLLGEDGKCVGKISVARDVTERNRSEEALRAARATAESANQAKSAFLARMSHEIRTPMNGVLGMTELLLETELSSTQRKYAETVHRSGNNLLGIINDVLDFSKIEAGKLELERVDFDLRRTLEDVVDMLAERAHVKGLELACSVPSNIPLRVVGDPLRMGQILTNLTGNAIKFTEKGSVLISVSCIDDGRDTATMRFDVKDTGLGISREAQGRIFEEFSQADGSTTRQHGGSGLGLAISKQLVEMMKGSLHVESDIGKGSTFWFTAVFKKQTQSRDVNLKTIPMTTLIGVRALIIEANALGRSILHEQVNGWGMATSVAGSPEHALALLQQAVARGAPMDLAIIDLGMAGGDPLALARTIKADPVIGKLKLAMLAPVGNHAVILDAREAGIDVCLVKPVRQSNLYESLVGVMRAENKAPERRKADVAASAGSQKQGAVLLVEDNPVNQAVALGMLKKLLGYDDIIVANNGKEAVDAWSQNRFDLILMDCHMPEMDGFQAATEIRKREAPSGKRVPIVALTANAMAQDREDCLKAGMDDHLGKPFSRKQIEEMLERWMPKENFARRAADAKPAA